MFRTLDLSPEILSTVHPTGLSFHHGVGGILKEYSGVFQPKSLSTPSLPQTRIFAALPYTEKTIYKNLLKIEVGGQSLVPQLVADVQSLDYLFR